MNIFQKIFNKIFKPRSQQNVIDDLGNKKSNIINKEKSKARSKAANKINSKKNNMRQLTVNKMAKQQRRREAREEKRKARQQYEAERAQRRLESKQRRQEYQRKYAELKRQERQEKLYKAAMKAAAIKSYLNNLKEFDSWRVRENKKFFQELVDKYTTEIPDEVVKAFENYFSAMEELESTSKNYDKESYRELYYSIGRELEEQLDMIGWDKVNPSLDLHLYHD